jgi:hypothetical protein
MAMDADGGARQSRLEAYLNAYGPLPPPEVPGTGSEVPADTHLQPPDEPVVTGTLFLMILLLTIVGGYWIILFGYLLSR